MAECNYCGKSYETQKEAQKCFESHRIIYVPIAREDLNRLVNFIYMPDQSLLNPIMVKVLKHYLQESAKK